MRAETGLSISVGVATTKFLAKLASDLAKPDGLLVVEPGTELDFLHPLPVRRLWGVGPATERKLGALGVRTVGNLAAIPEDTLVRTLGNASGHHLHVLAWNRDERPVVPDQEVKSIGHEETFPVDLHDQVALGHRIVSLADGVASRLRAAGVGARTVQLKVRFGDFTTVTRSRTLPEPDRSRRRPGRRVAVTSSGPSTSAGVSACSASPASSWCARIPCPVRARSRAWSRPAVRAWSRIRGRCSPRPPRALRKAPKPPPAPIGRRRSSGRSTPCGPVSARVPSGPERPRASLGKVRGAPRVERGDYRARQWVSTTRRA